MTTSVLCVDDDPNVLAGYRRNLRKQFDIEVATSGAEALTCLERNGPYAVVVADMNMPLMNGVELLKSVETRWPDTVRMMLTGNADQQTAARAVNDGHVYRFLNKPCPPEMLALALDAGVKQYRLVTAERELLESTLNGAVKVLTDILAMVHPTSFGQGQKLREHMAEFLNSMGVRPNWELDLAALLSQIGYVAIPPSVLQKLRENYPLTGPENDMLRRIPQIGSDLLANIPRLEGVAKVILHQARNFDGTGFPCDSASGEEIPLGARILKVLCDLQSLETAGIPRPEALLTLRNRKGIYDPRVLDAAFKCFDVYLAVSCSAAAKPLLRTVDELHSGMLLLSNVETEDGMLIVAAGNKLTSVMAEKIRNFDRVSGVKEPICVSS